MKIKNFCNAILEVEIVLKKLENICEDEPLKRETQSIRMAYEQRRIALEKLIITTNDE